MIWPKGLIVPVDEADGLKCGTGNGARCEDVAELRARIEAALLLVDSVERGMREAGKESKAMNLLCDGIRLTLTTPAEDIADALNAARASTT